MFGEFPNMHAAPLRLAHLYFLVLHISRSQGAAYPSGHRDVAHHIGLIPTIRTPTATILLYPALASSLMIQIAR